jgi:hypothetical protein
MLPTRNDIAIYGAKLARMAPILNRLGCVYNNIHSKKLWLSFFPTAPPRQDASNGATPLSPSPRDSLTMPVNPLVSLLSLLFLLFLVRQRSSISLHRLLCCAC